MDLNDQAWMPEPTTNDNCLLHFQQTLQMAQLKHDQSNGLPQMIHKNELDLFDCDYRFRRPPTTYMTERQYMRLLCFKSMVREHLLGADDQAPIVE